MHQKLEPGGHYDFQKHSAIILQLIYTVGMKVGKRNKSAWKGLFSKLENVVSLVTQAARTALEKQSSIHTKNHNHFLRALQEPFNRTTFDFQGPLTRKVISHIAQNCTLAVHSNRTLRFELFAPPTSLNFSVYLCLNKIMRMAHCFFFTIFSLCHSTRIKFLSTTFTTMT